MLKTVAVPLALVSALLIAPSAASAEVNAIKPQSLTSQAHGFTTALAEPMVPSEAPLAVEVEPPSRGAELLATALTQVGIAQDCTDLVQNSLAAMGLTIRRDQGGFDYGVQQLAVFGYQVPASEAQPGDIAIIGPDNGGHVWVIGDPATGEGVHGGFSGTTAYASNGVAISAHAVYRLH